MTTQEQPMYVQDEGDLRKYFATIPNLIDDADLSVYAYRLYGHLKRVAGDGGTCFQSTTTLAAICKMSRGKVSEAKAELEAAGFVAIERLMRGQEQERHRITIIDIWAETTARYGKGGKPRTTEERPAYDAQQGSVHHMNTCSQEGEVFTTRTGCSPHEQVGVHHMNGVFTTASHKKNPYKKNPLSEEEPIKENEAPPPRSSAVPPAPPVALSSSVLDKAASDSETQDAPLPASARAKTSAPRTKPAGKGESVAHAPRSFPPTEPAAGTAAHVLWRVEMLRGNLLTRSAAAREAGAAQEMLDAGYDEATILRHFEAVDNDAKRQTPYSLHYLKSDIAGHVARAQRRALPAQTSAPQGGGLAASARQIVATLSPEYRSLFDPPTTSAPSLPVV